MASNTVPSASSSTQDDSDIITTNSDTLSSVPSDLSDEDALQPAPSKKRPRKAKATKTWSYARAPTGSEPVRDDKKRRIWYCQWAQCKDYSATITSNIRYHMKNKHGVDIEEEVSLVKKATHARLESLFEKQEQQANMRADQKKEAILKSVVNKVIVQEALAQLIIVRNLPYNCVEWAELRALLLAVNYTCEPVLVNSHSTVPAIIERSFLLDRNALKTKLRNSASLIHFSIDGWTAPNHRHFLAICAHFVEGNKLCKALLALPEMIGGHGSEIQAPALFQAFKEYNIIDRIGYFVSDNHPCNDKLPRLLAQGLKDRKLPIWNPQQRRIRCLGHILNLSVQAFLFAKDEEAVEAAFSTVDEEEDNPEASIDDALAAKYKAAQEMTWRQMGPLGKIHNLGVFIRASEERYNAFLHLAGRMLPMDNDTRWNSWYSMLDVALIPRVRDAINKTTEQHYSSTKLDYLSPDDWELLRQTHEFLQPFYRITKNDQSDYSTLDQVLYDMDFIVHHFKQSEAKYGKNPRLLSSIRTGWYAFDKWYKKTDAVAAYAAALLLHPARRKAYINRQWLQKWRTPAIKRVEDLWKKEYMHKAPPSRTALSDKQPIQEPDEYDRWNRQNNALLAVKDEFNDFIDDRPVPLASSQTALDWWLQPQQQAHYPTLSLMAIDILSIPPMSAEPERIFSGARRTIAWDRMRLGSRNIERTECLKSWLRSYITTGIKGVEEIERLEDLVLSGDGEVEAGW